MPNLDSLTVWMDDTHWFPFTESDRCDITGPGHQDPQAFVEQVRAYDEYLIGDEAEAMDTQSVRHQWILINVEDECFETADSQTPGAIPVTTIWGVR